MAQRPTWPRRPNTDFRPTSLTTRRSCFSRSYVGADPLFLRDAGKPVELDALVTVVQELGVLTGVPTPFTDALLGLARLQARVRGLY